MPRLVHATPKYRLHKRSRQAVVTIQGKDRYLGPHGSSLSRANYAREIAEWLSKGRLNRMVPTSGELTIAELISSFWEFVQSHYVKHGAPTGQQDCIRSALCPLRRLYGNTPACQFGPVAMKAVRQAMLDTGTKLALDEKYNGLSRPTINRYVGLIRRMFRWAASEELVPVTVYQALATLPGLQRGRCKAREPEPVGPVAESAISAAMEHLSPIISDMVQFQRLCGCRPDEVCSLRPCDVETATDDGVWHYVPQTHKTEHRGRKRTILIGPKAQKILRPYLLRDHRSYCFVPSESEKRRNQLRRLHRESPMTPSQAARRPKRHRRRAHGECYTSASYRRAIHRACDKAKIDRWSPNRLRHTAATDIRKRFGLDAAQVILGHSRMAVTEVYAERDLAKGITVAREVG